MAEKKQSPLIQFKHCCQFYKRWVIENEAEYKRQHEELQVSIQESQNNGCEISAENYIDMLIYERSTEIIGYVNEVFSQIEETCGERKKTVVWIAYFGDDTSPDYKRKADFILRQVIGD